MGIIYLNLRKRQINERIIALGLPKQTLGQEMETTTARHA